MAILKIDPIKVAGPWSDGYVLERRHTLSSEFLGHDSWGNPQFDTKRSDLGELIYRLKNRNEKQTVDSIAETAVAFIREWKPQCDMIVPMPPSRNRDTYQPVMEISTAIGNLLGVLVSASAATKTKETPQLKDVYDYSERIKHLRGAFQVECNEVRGRRILLIDDLYRSGATASVVTNDILGAGAAAVYLLAMTKTRIRI